MLEVPPSQLPQTMDQDFHDGEIVNLILRHVGSQWILYSRHKGAGGKRKRLGTFRSRAAGIRRERQIEYFKRMG